MALSLAPTLLILLAISGFAFGANAAEGHLVSQIQSLVGVDGARVIRGLLKGTHQPSSGITATVLGLVTLFFSATAVVSELQDALNTIWKVSEDTTCSRVRSMLNLVTERLLSFVLVFGAGLFLLVSLIGECVDFCRRPVPDLSRSSATCLDSDRRLRSLLCGHHGFVRLHF